MTRQIAEVSKPLGVAAHDHIIVGRDGHEYEGDGADVRNKK
jgi:DNA repair protein RadC